MYDVVCLAYFSLLYRTGTLTKARIVVQLLTVFAIHDQVKARVHIDDVRMVGELAWVYSTGEVTGRLRWLGGSVPVLSWQRELEVARRENGRWRLYGASSDVFRVHFSPAARVTAAWKCGSAIREVTG